MVLKLVGGCMRPLLNNGDFCFIHNIKKIKRGDIVAYKIKNEFFIHRVVKFNNNNKIIVCDDCGVSNPHEISFENIFGVYRCILSGYLGYFYHFIIRTIFIFLRRLKYWLNNKI